MAFYDNPSEAGLEHFNRLPLFKEWYSLSCSHIFPQEPSIVSHIIGSKKPWPLLIFLHTRRKRKITELYGFHVFGKIQNFNIQHQSSTSLSLSLSLPLSVLFLVEERTAQLLYKAPQRYWGKGLALSQSNLQYLYNCYDTRMQFYGPRYDSRHVHWIHISIVFFGL